MLADFASGTTSHAVSLLVASHLTQAPESRARVQAYEDAGGVLLRDETPEAISHDSFDAVMAMIDALPQEAANVDAEPVDAELLDAKPEGAQPETGETCPLPRPVMDAVGMAFDEIPWRFKLPGVATYDLESFGEHQVSLMRARPGASVPQHTHKGTELTLVMQGIMLDDGIEYRAGDVAVNTEDDDHRPKILGDEVCYCLIVQQGDLHFTGRFSRILNYIGE